MADAPQPQPAPTALDHAEATLGHLRAQRPGDGHDLARAMLASASAYLVEMFGREHALQVAADLLRPLFGVPAVPEPDEVPGLGEPAPAAAPAVTVH